MSTLGPRPHVFNFYHGEARHLLSFILPGRLHTDGDSASFDALEAGGTVEPVAAIHRALPETDARHLLYLQLHSARWRHTGPLVLIR